MYSRAMFSAVLMLLLLPGANGQTESQPDTDCGETQLLTILSQPPYKIHFEETLSILENQFSDYYSAAVDYLDISLFSKNVHAHLMAQGPKLDQKLQALFTQLQITASTQDICQQATNSYLTQQAQSVTDVVTDFSERLSALQAISNLEGTNSPIQ